MQMNEISGANFKAMYEYKSKIIELESQLE